MLGTDCRRASKRVLTATLLISEMQDLSEENHELLRYLRRVQQCLEVTNAAMKTNQTSVAVRRKRIPLGGLADQTDRVGLELRKETDLIGDSVRQIREFLSTAEKHVRSPSNGRYMRVCGNSICVRFSLTRMKSPSSASCATGR